MLISFIFGLIVGLFGNLLVQYMSDPLSVFARKPVVTPELAFTVSGYVTDASSNPIHHVSVEPAIKGFRARGSTDENGYYSVTVPGCIGELSCFASFKYNARGYEDKSVYTQLLGGESATQDVYLEKERDERNDGDLTIPEPTMDVSEDGTTPEVHINFPIDGSSHSTYSILIRASASDNVDISHILFYVNDVLESVDTEPEDIYDGPISPNNVYEPEYSYSWTPPRRGTTYVIEAHAFDLAGNSVIDTVQMSTYERTKNK